MRILVVDDEQSICQLLEEFLLLKGYEVSTATNGDDAITQFKRQTPHVVLLDIKMPGMTGIEVLRRIRETDRTTAVVMLSAFGDVDTIRNALSIGANYYVEKPVDLQRLEKILHFCHGPAVREEAT